MIAEFKRFDEVTLDQVYGEIGVYVIWDGKAKINPTYIGEGQILHRFASHVRDELFFWPIRGVVAMLGQESASAKIQAKIMESVLLRISDEIDRFPTVNDNMGTKSKIIKILRRCNLLKIYVKRCDPLILGNPVLYQPKIVTLELNTEQDDFDVYHPWKTRQKRMARKKW